VEPVGYADQHGRLYSIEVIKQLEMNTHEMIPVFTHQAPATERGEVVVTWSQDGQIQAVTRQDSGLRR